MSLCKGCMGFMTWTDKKKQYYRAKKKTVDEATLKEICPRCQKCMTRYLNENKDRFSALRRKMSKEELEIWLSTFILDYKYLNQIDKDHILNFINGLNKEYPNFVDLTDYEMVNKLEDMANRLRFDTVVPKEREEIEFLFGGE